MPDNGYPTEQELDKLANFYGTPKDFVDYLDSIYQNGFGNVKDGTGIYGRPAKIVETATGGWSGCEEIDLVIHRGIGEESGVGIFYMRYWESTHRGGLTRYTVPDDQWEVEQYLGDVRNWRDS